MSLPVLPKEQRIQLDKVDEAFEEGWRQALENLAILPEADVVEVMHGRFLGTAFDGYEDGRPVYFEWQCSACGCIFEDEEPTFRFCPWCGAKMDLPEPPEEEA